MMEDNEKEKQVPEKPEGEEVTTNVGKIGAEAEEENPIEQARKVNEEKANLLDREEKLQAKKEKFHAEQMVGGHTQAGQGAVTAKETDAEYTARVLKGEI